MSENKQLDEWIRTWLSQDTDMPDSVRSVIDQTLTFLPDAKPRKKRIWLRNTGIAVGTAAILFFGAGFLSPAVAQVLQHIPFIGSVFEQAGDQGLQQVKRQGQTVTADQTATDKGFSLTISEAFYDGSRLSIGYILRSSRSKSDWGALDMDVYVDGKKIAFSWNGGSGQVADDQTEILVTDIHPETPLPDRFTLTLDVHKIGQVEGSWKFSFPVTKMHGSQTYTMTASRTYKDIKLTAKEVTLAPSSTRIVLQLVKPHEFPTPENAARGYAIREYSYEIQDDKGNPIQMMSGSSEGTVKEGKEVHNTVITAAPLLSRPKFLQIQTFVSVRTARPIPESGKMEQTQTNPVPVKELELIVPLK